jgi:hypothetical protein
VIISTPSRYRVSNLVRVMLGRRVALMSRHHVTEYSVGQMEEMLRWGGFTVECMASRPSGSLQSRMALALGAALRRLLKSHHRFKPTIFYAARRQTA